MAQAFNGLAMDQPEGSSKTNPYAAEAWLEPWLIKHSGFYRRHLAHGRTESKATRRHSEVSEALDSRQNSVADAEPEPEHRLETEAATTAAMPVPLEQHSLTEAVADEAPAQAVEVTAENKTKEAAARHSWRKHLRWFPHP
ncbi:hypothetical protein HRR83_001998 [Exophiala dermatitidis]|uniref:Uncharacterized protein n=2 Tax=Exophiala dermatitidis TaxID=5970 RepID=H6BZ60_EXODN|nr:uncharacterized protein HMPREF1120_04987 [Exophiala dermatitidis NIH/UT8656]KAJ4514353.1 hypothetical protein HRR73_005379 [Exophiala dermatitidis]EHY56923.1 hypothetical protein HMPREF1120_04987 [Exophiala dermatitidis NIH/UT8656]KAJ4520040.1 hypothetical protein HRR75_001903 [Exophiala dermatitidis]KAJ4523880.1 hypothetical protein HRR74_002075 [Exophiala dermatitidis]KAJ4537180.1 hypothetical protein HRR76_005193 [Exophiala dermatitidis]